jgi:hypothetical protein
MIFAFIDVTDGRAFVYQMSLDEIRESVMKVIFFFNAVNPLRCSPLSIFG